MRSINRNNRETYAVRTIFVLPEMEWKRINKTRETKGGTINITKFPSISLFRYDLINWIELTTNKLHCLFSHSHIRCKIQSGKIITRNAMTWTRKWHRNDNEKNITTLLIIMLIARSSLNRNSINFSAPWIIIKYFERGNNRHLVIPALYT